MALTSPFHPVLSELNATGLYGHWMGYLSPIKYQLSSKHEYFAVRNAVGFFDASPLNKYMIRGRDAEKFLAGVMARDVRTCKPGRAQYQVWCDDNGYVLEDGVLFRLAPDEFFLTAAEPNLSYLRGLVGRLEVEIEDVSTQFGALQIQGPRSRVVLASLAPEVNDLPFFAVTNAKIEGHPVIISRTGFSGDLGYEMFVPVDSAIPVLNALLGAGNGHQIRPYGEEALAMARIEAGLPLIGAEFNSARYAYNEHQRFTPDELGFGWLLKGIEDPSRPFIGRRAILKERAEGLSRWKTVGLMVDWKAYNDLYVSQGLIPEYDEIPVGWVTMLYDADGNKAGYATSFMYSPMMQRYIGIARVKPEFSEIGNVVHVEQTVNNEYHTVPAEIVKMPFYNPERKMA
jgi:aminomethyltransferase